MAMKLFFSTAIAVFIFPVCFCQISPVTPSSLSIAGTSVADITEYAPFANPAHLGYVGATEVAAQYENRYLLSQLSTKSLYMALPTKLINVSFSGSYSGYKYYNEILFGVVFSRSFSNRFSIGVQLDYLTAYFAARNRYQGAFFPQVGLDVRLTEQINLSFSTFNPFQTHIVKENSLKKIPSVFSLGMQYCFSDDFRMRLQADKEISSLYTLAVGADYRIMNAFTAKIGFYDSGYLVPCVGVDAGLGSLVFGINGELHPLLGLVSIARLKYVFKK